jgi:hypothetical protein
MGRALNVASKNEPAFPGAARRAPSPLRPRLGVTAALAFALQVFASGSLALAISLPAGLPPDTKPVTPAQLVVLLNYQRDPVGGRAAVLEYAKGPLDDLPIVMLLAIADANLRGGRIRTAGRFFSETIDRNPGPPWTTFAQLGLGWSSVLTGDYTAAERYYGSAAGDGDAGRMAQIMLGWLMAVRGRSREAIAIFDEWSDSPTTSDELRQVALLGTGYAWYWSGDYDRAAHVFDRLATASPHVGLVDDARYAAAWSRVRYGDVSTAVPALIALANGAPTDADDHVPRSLVRLAPMSVLRAGRKRAFRAAEFVNPELRMAALFDGDGAAVARAALAELVQDGDITQEEVPVSLRLTRPVDRRETPAKLTAPAAPMPSPITSEETSPSRLPWIVVLLLLGIALAMWTRRPSAVRR